MILFYFFLNRITCQDISKNGLSTVTVSPNNPLNIKLENRFCIISCLKPSSLLILYRNKIDSKVNSITDFQENRFSFTGFDLNISSSNSVLLSVWIISEPVCSNSSVELIASRSMILHSYIGSFSGNLCIFSQTETQRITGSIKASSLDRHFITEIYDINNKLITKCQHNKTCPFTSDFPIFFRLSSEKDRSLDLSINYIVSGAQLNVHHCRYQSYPLLTYKNENNSDNLDVKTFLGTSEVKCLSAEHEMLRFLQYMKIFFISIIMLLVFLQFFGIIDFRAIISPPPELYDHGYSRRPSVLPEHTKPDDMLESNPDNGESTIIDSDNIQEQENLEDSV